MERIKFEIGDVVRLKKAHPCGSERWEIYRTGIDFGIRCLGCGHRVMIPRTKFERAVREIQKKNPPTGDGKTSP